MLIPGEVRVCVSPVSLHANIPYPATCRFSCGSGITSPLLLCARVCVGECEKGYAEGLSVDGALYMTAVTASTVGYGDFTPQSTWGKIFAILYFPIAVALMSKTILTVSMIPTEYRNHRSSHLYHFLSS